MDGNSVWLLVKNHEKYSTFYWKRTEFVLGNIFTLWHNSKEYEPGTQWIYWEYSEILSIEWLQITHSRIPSIFPCKTGVQAADLKTQGLGNRKLAPNDLKPLEWGNIKFNSLYNLEINSSWKVLVKCWENYPI